MGAVHSSIRARMAARAAAADVVVIFGQNEPHALATARRIGAPFAKVIPIGWDDPQWGLVKVQRQRFTNASMFIGEWGCEAELRERFPASFADRTITDGWAP